MRSSLIFFECLDDDDVAWIYHACHKADYADKDILIDAGMVAAEIFILLEGKCRVESVAGQFLDLLSSGDIRCNHIGVGEGRPCCIGPTGRHSGRFGSSYIPA